MYTKKAVKCYEEGRVFQQKGKLSDAERAYKKAIKINQDFIEAHNDLGNVLLDRGRYKEAFNSFRKALTLRPDHPMLLTNLGNALQLQGEVEKAIGCFKKAIEKDAKFIGAHNNLGNALRDLGRFREAVVSYENAININPKIADTYFNLASVLVLLDELEQAVTNFKKAIEINPGHKKALIGLGRILSEMGELDQAITSYRKAIEIDPGHEDAYIELAKTLSDMGEIEQALISYRKAIEVNPENTHVYRSYAKNKKFSEYDDDIRSMETLFAKKDFSDEQKLHLAFALGKAYEDLGKFEKSMEFIIEASRLKRASFEFSISASEILFSKMKQTFSLEFFADRKGMGNPDQTPIFILGMPRSGTSLVEQILASHADVFGAGELRDVSILAAKIDSFNSSTEFPGCIIDLDSVVLEDLGKQYITGLRNHSVDAKHITDKMPHNFQYIGFIKSILPNARIICCTRDPMDNCLSLFKNYFSSENNYSYDMTELGQYYNLYLDLMAHWRNTLPGFIYDLSYERLVADQEKEIKKLLEFCRLPWDDACLDFHNTRRRVQTASNAQVRRPIYKDSVKLWKRYEKQLEPLRAAIYG